jgi:MYXO-CTERM domain-containing protein
MRSWSLELAVLTIVVTAFAAPAAASGKLALRGHRVHGLAGGSSGANCTRTEYNGGALIPQVKIVVVQWGGASSYASQLAGFYSGMLQSPYMDWLREYDEPSYSIVRGEFAGVFVDPSPPGKTTVDDINDVQPELERLVTAGAVPAPDANTLYMIHFGPGIVITQGGDPSCSSSSNNSYCAYHGNVMSGGAMLRYAVIPDMSPAGCAQGCNIGSSSDPFVAATVSASHEMVEAITDPDDFGGWYDNSCDEIADMCENDTMPGSAAGYTVQLIWSQKQAACIDHDASVMVGDYALALDHAEVSGAPGDPVSANVIATPVAGTPAASLGLTVSGLPSGITAALSPTSIMTSGSSMLTFQLDSSVALGSYPFTVTGASTPDNVIHSVSGTLMVQLAGPPDLASPAFSDGGIPDDSDGGTGGVGSGGNHPAGSAGCSCSFGGAPSSGTGWLLLLSIAFVAVLGRRRLARA